MNRQHLFLALGVIAVSFAAIFIRLAEAPSLVIAAYRLCIASLIIIPFALARSGQEFRRLTRREIALAVFSGVFLAAHFVLWITSLGLTSVATSVVLVTASPIFVAAGSYLFLREKLSRRTGVGILISIAGAVAIGLANWHIGALPLYGGLMALAGALAVAGYMLIGRRLLKSIGLLSYISLAYGTAAVILLAAALAFGFKLTGYSAETYTMMVLLAIVPQVIGHSLLNRSLRFLPATMVTVAVLGEPVGATVLAFLILSESPSLTEVGGGLLILLGIFIAFRNSEILPGRR